MEALTLTQREIEKQIDIDWINDRVANPEPHADDCYTMLYANVLMRGLKDALGVDKLGAKEHEALESIKWATQPNQDFIDTCEILGFNETVTGEIQSVMREAMTNSEFKARLKTRMADMSGRRESRGTVNYTPSTQYNPEIILHVLHIN